VSFLVRNHDTANVRIVEKLQHRISAFALVCPLYDVASIKNEKLCSFLAKRARAWVQSQDPINSPTQDDDAGPNQGTLCPTFSGGKFGLREMFIAHARSSILEFFREVYSDPEFVNPEFLYPERDDEGNLTGIERKFEYGAFPPTEDDDQAPGI
jgi:hypothetical protein